MSHHCGLCAAGEDADKAVGIMGSGESLMGEEETRVEMKHTQRTTHNMDDVNAV